MESRVGEKGVDAEVAGILFKPENSATKRRYKDMFFDHPRHQLGVGTPRHLSRVDVTGVGNQSNSSNALSSLSPNNIPYSTLLWLHKLVILDQSSPSPFSLILAILAAAITMARRVAFCGSPLYHTNDKDSL